MYRLKDLPRGSLLDDDDDPAPNPDPDPAPNPAPDPDPALPSLAVESDNSILMISVEVAGSGCFLFFTNEGCSLAAADADAAPHSSSALRFSPLPLEAPTAPAASMAAVGPFANRHRQLA